MTHMNRKDLIQFPAETTSSPYENQVVNPMKRSHEEPGAQYFYDPRQMEAMSKTKKYCDRSNKPPGKLNLKIMAQKIN